MKLLLSHSQKVIRGFRQLTESPVLLKSVSDVEEFINYCPPQEISANSCVLGLYGTSDKNG